MPFIKFLDVSSSFGAEVKAVVQSKNDVLCTLEIVGTTGFDG